MKLTLGQIRKDLRMLRIYYANQTRLDRMLRYIPHGITDLVKVYTARIKDAPLELYMLFCELYVNGSTQENAAEQLGYCTEYVRKRTKQLLEYLQSKTEDGR